MEEEKIIKRGKLIPLILLSLSLTGANRPIPPAHGAWQEQTAETERGSVEPAARVNGVEIALPVLRKTFERNMEERGIELDKIESPEELTKLRMEVLHVLIDQELLWQDARDKGIVAKEEDVDIAIAAITRGIPFEEAFAAILEEGGFTEESYREFMRAQISVSMLIRKEIAPGVTVSDEEVHRYFVQNPHLFTSPEEVRARQIMVRARGSADEDTRKEARGKIEGVLAEVRGGADFAMLARKYSEGSEAPRGGDLGFLGRGTMPPPLEEAAFSLKPGGISEVVRTPMGYHIIKVEERRGGEVLPEEDVSEKIRETLTRMRIREGVQERVKKLREDAAIEILISQ